MEKHVKTNAYLSRTENSKSFSCFVLAVSPWISLLECQSSLALFVSGIFCENWNGCEDAVTKFDSKRLWVPVYPGSLICLCLFPPYPRVAPSMVDRSMAWATTTKLRKIPLKVVFFAAGVSAASRGKLLQNWRLSVYNSIEVCFFW